ncbi:pimeloyl-ACP methyl ester esterase BioH [Vibrio cincinnatiensis]|uniref:pimeloyl-ACP methyl ester esterase BioH n=1 Tax=Vibrio cincinnatiensis TaxID=675 RepID=UPI0012AC9182|nr:pimeloyl-ACP methyl ester esterase BioH [Vibrio cincinnatiensis]
MTTDLYWQVKGEGPDLVLVHGWGMNGAVWEQACEQLRDKFRVHMVDLPGYGHSAEFCADDLAQIAQELVKQAPRKAVWVGWSLGGLVATYMALNYPDYVVKLITVASSPKFAAAEQEYPTWRGIKPHVLTAFTEQLLTDFHPTVERFLALQAMGSPSARQDIKRLKQAILSRPAPNPTALLSGLKILANTDLRPQLAQLSTPTLRLYGRLDGLVPVKIAQELNDLMPESGVHIFPLSAHAPFLTELDDFCQQIIQFANNV